MSRTLQIVVMLTVSIAVVCGLHYYFYKRLIVDLLTTPAARRAGMVALGLLTLNLFAWPIYGRVFGGSSLGDFLSLIGFTWMGYGFYLALMLGAGDSLRALFTTVMKTEIAVDPERRMLLARSVAAGAGTLAAATASYGFWRAYAPPEIVEVPIKLPGLPPQLSGLTIVQVSDIHVGPTIKRKFMEEMVARVNALKPDVVAITGDLVDGSVDRLGHAVSALQDLKSRYGSYFVNGNHEYYSGHLEWDAFLERLGIDVLRNRTVSIGDTARINLVGVDDWSAQRQFPGEGYDLQRALESRDPSLPSVLLAHQPRNFEEVAKSGVGLQLSGHTHGGQFLPWNLAVQLVFPHIAGLYREHDSHLYVNRGTGFWGPPIRVGAPPEITKLVLT